ncbi:MAG: AI-2E family transporter, partial [Acidimicrobiia bacterium]|nr:AI-2E family transporter [Acidimicrobiia bacterium]
VTFVTSYVPYLGAIFSGAFAVLIALGSTGTRDAIIMLLVILVVQNIVQTLMLTKLSSDLLNLHPIVNLASTIVGAAMAGLLGAMLSAPVVAIAIAVQQRLAAQRHAGTADLTGATDHL